MGLYHDTTWLVDGVGTVCGLGRIGDTFFLRREVRGRRSDGERSCRRKGVGSPGCAVYPEIARRMSITGTVKLSVVLTSTGTVKSRRKSAGIRSW